MEKMLCQFYVLIGILAVCLASGVQIDKQSTDLIFLDGGHLSLTCEQRTLSDRSADLKFLINSNSNISQFSPQRTYENGMSKLSLKKQLMVDDDGTYICQSSVDNSETSVQVQVFKNTHEYEQKRYVKDSTNLLEGETLALVCPVLDKLMATVDWSRQESNLRSNAKYENVGNTMVKGKLIIDDIKSDDRGHYSCTADWKTGNATFVHLVRVKSRLAPLWPAIGIIAEIIILVAIILLCKERKKKNHESQPLSAPSTSGNSDKGSRRKYATSST